jgi:hypothetical protein
MFKPEGRDEAKLPELKAAFEEKLQQLEELLGRHEGPFLMGCAAQGPRAPPRAHHTQRQPCCLPCLAHTSRQGSERHLRRRAWPAILG